MKTGTCPKCAGTNIHTNKGDVHPGDHNYLGKVGLSGLYCFSYVCVDCGYLEDYMERRARAKIAEKWTKV